MVFLLLYACKEEEILVNDGNYFPPESNEPPELLWQIPLNPDHAVYFSMTPVLNNGNIIFSAKNYLINAPTDLICIDSAYQTIIWESNDDFHDGCGTMSTLKGNGYGTYLNYLVALCDNNPRITDLNTGNVLWDYSAPHGDSFITLWNDKFFHGHLTGTNPFTTSTILMSDVLSPTFDTVFHVEMENDYSCHLYPPAVTIDANNDTLMFFQNRQWKSPPYDGKVDFYGYNYSSKTLMWKLENIDNYGSSAVFPPVIADGKVYFKADYTIYCFDQYSGDVVWSWQPEPFEDLLLPNLLIVDDKLIVKTSGYGLYALSLLSGNVIWQNQEAGATPAEITCYENTLYYVTDSDSKLHAIDASDGSEKWSITSSSVPTDITSTQYFYNGVRIDPVTNRLYITDNYNLNCYQLK